jgi:hypothetical protein
MDECEALQPVIIALDRVEIQFLLTVLASCGEILALLLALQEGLPENAPPPPLRAEAIGNIAGLARKIAAQAGVEGA